MSIDRVSLCAAMLWAFLATPTLLADAIEVNLRSEVTSSQILTGAATVTWSYRGEILTGPASSLTPIPNSYLGPVIRVNTGDHFLARLLARCAAHPLEDRRPPTGRRRVAQPSAQHTTEVIVKRVQVAVRWATSPLGVPRAVAPWSRRSRHCRSVRGCEANRYARMNYSLWLITFYQLPLSQGTTS
jgi:hypothetical protein